MNERKTDKDREAESIKEGEGWGREWKEGKEREWQRECWQTSPTIGFGCRSVHTLTCLLSLASSGIPSRWPCLSSPATGSDSTPSPAALLTKVEPFRQVFALDVSTYLLCLRWQWTIGSVGARCLMWPAAPHWDSTVFAHAPSIVMCLSVRTDVFTIP